MNPPKDLGRTKMGKRREKHLCPPQIFGFFPFPVQGFKARIGLREILSSVLSSLLRRGERKKTRSETSSQPANNFDYCSAEGAKVLAPWNNHVPTHPSLQACYST